MGKKAGVGIAISYNEIGNAVLAGIQGSVVNNKGGSVSVTAEDNSALGGGAVGVGVGMGEAMFAGAGSIQVNRVHSAVAAYVLPRYVNNVAVAGSSAITANALTVKATENNAGGRDRRRGGDAGRIRGRGGLGERQRIQLAHQRADREQRDRCAASWTCRRILRR